MDARPEHRFFAQIADSTSSLIIFASSSARSDTFGSNIFVNRAPISGIAIVLEWMTRVHRPVAPPHHNDDLPAGERRRPDELDRQYVQPVLDPTMT